MQEITAKTPWKAHLGDLPVHLDYFEGSMYEMVERVVQKQPKAIAFDFMGRSTTYEAMLRRIQTCAKALNTKPRLKTLIRPDIFRCGCVAPPRRTYGYAYGLAPCRNEKSLAQL